MDRIIEVKVNGNYVFKDSQNAGSQGEGNITALRIEFDDGWDGFSKIITWWDAKGENPTSRVLTTDLLEDITASSRVYLILIPPEPLAIWGKCMFAIDGYTNGKRQKSAYAEMIVKPNGNGQDVMIEEPSPGQIEQLQVQIDAIMEDIAKAAVAADAKEAAAKSASEAAVSASNAAKSASDAASSAQAAASSQSAASTSATNAKNSETAAQNSATAAGTAQKAAETAKAEAGTAAAQASESAQRAAQSASSAASSASAAVQNATVAYNAASAAKTSETNAAKSASDANAAKTAAQTAQEAAEKARDEAQEIAGGDFATDADAKKYASTAESNANAYTDKQIAAIPTPDVSGQIGEHNTSTESHNDIRLLIEDLATRLNALANSDDTTLDQMAELVAYIKDNRELIEQITTEKVSVTDIVNNLTTNVSNKPLSAAMGVELKAQADNAMNQANAAQTTAYNAQSTADGKASMAEVNAAITAAIGAAIGGSY